MFYPWLEFIYRTNTNKLHICIMFTFLKWHPHWFGTTHVACSKFNACPIRLEGLKRARSAGKTGYSSRFNEWCLNVLPMRIMMLYGARSSSSESSSSADNGLRQSRLWPPPGGATAQRQHQNQQAGLWRTSHFIDIYLKLSQQLVRKQSSCCTAVRPIRPIGFGQMLLKTAPF